MKSQWTWYLKGAVVVVACFICIQAKSQITPVSIRKAIDIALANNYSLKADSLNIVATSYQTSITKAEFRPRANYSSRAEYNPAIPSQMLPGHIVGQPGKDYVPVQFGTAYGMNNGVELSQTLFRKSTRIQVNAAGLYNGIARTRHSLTREDLVYQVATAFYDLQTSAEQIRITDRDYRNLHEIVVIAKAQFDNGVLKRIDYESLEINAANKLSQLTQLQSKYTEQLTYFKYLLGIPAESIIAIDDTIRVAPATSVAIDNPLWGRQDLLLSRQLIQAKEVELKSIKAEKYPVTTAYFRFNYQSQFNNAGDAFKNDYSYKSSTIGISTTISLFDGHRRKNRANIAQTELQQLKLKNERQQQLANTEWITANVNLRNDREQFRITQHNLALAEKVFASRKSLYTEGVTTLIELLDAERELSQARNLYIQAMANVQTSQVNVHKAKGTLLTEFLNSL
jgi:outer membrane protein